MKKVHKRNFLNIKLLGVFFSLITVVVLPHPSRADFLLATYNCPQGEESLGYTLDGGGDLNGDGISDFAMASTILEEPIRGKVYVYFGSHTVPEDPDLEISLASSANFLDHSLIISEDLNDDGFDDLVMGQGFYDIKAGRVDIFFGGCDMDTVPDISLFGENMQDWFGSTVASLGDINGDGYADLGVGASAFHGQGENRGRLYIYLGGPSFDANPDYLLDGKDDLGYFASSLDGGFDVNGDGFDDMIVGQLSLFHQGEWNGAIFIFHGGPSFDMEHDFLLLDPEPPKGDFGFVNCIAGDVNGDGYADIAAGDTWTPGGGAVYVYFGGLEMDDIFDLKLQGKENASTFGNEIHRTGDLNGDGSGDLVVGDWCAGGYPFAWGEAYIAYGGHFPDAILDITYKGSYGELRGEPVRGMGDVNDDGVEDYMIVSQGYMKCRLHGGERSKICIDEFFPIDPVVAPGAMLEFQVMVTNKTSSQCHFTGWIEGYTMAGLPGKNPLLISSVTLRPGQSVGKTLGIIVPEFLPEGTYVLILRVGSYPEEWANAHFSFEVSKQRTN